MKTHPIYLQALAALVGTALFHQTGWGLNALLVVLPVLALVWQAKRFSPAAALLFGLTTLSVTLSSSWLSLVLFWLFLFLLISQPQASLSWAAALPDGFWKLVKAPWLALEGKEQALFPGMSLGKSLLIGLPALGITLIFYALYASANPVFASTLSLAQLQLPEFSWFVLFLCLLYGSYALSRSFAPSALHVWDAQQPDVLLRRRRRGCSNPFWLKYEYKMALLVLVLLNGLLLLFHLIDASSYLQGHQPQGGVAYREWVHQGVGTLIISIVVAVALMVYVFRGNLNFFRQNESLKGLAKAWILQNAALALSAALKNWGYVATYGLTYKRIGVWVYLLLVLFGLFTTWKKIGDKQTLWWMIKSNLRVALMLLLLVSFFPWARLITLHNLQIAKMGDMKYLLNLPLHNTDLLLPYEHTLSEDQQTDLILRKEALLDMTKTENWKSWTLLDYYAAKNLELHR